MIQSLGKGFFFKLNILLSKIKIPWFLVYSNEFKTHEQKNYRKDNRLSLLTN